MSDERGRGVVYISRIPPFMRPAKLRHLLSQYGQVERMFLTPEDDYVKKLRAKSGGSRKSKFVDGWVEFVDGNVAQSVAETLNNTTVGGKKTSFFHDDIWSMRFLPGFKWSNLGEQRGYDRAVKSQRMRQQVSQARREDDDYLRLVEQAKKIEKMEERKSKKLSEDGDGDLSASDGEENLDETDEHDLARTEIADVRRARRSFRQRRVFIQDNDTPFPPELISKIFSG